METFFDTIRDFWLSLPQTATIPITLVGGWLGAVLLRFLLSRFLALVRLDRLSEKTGAAEFLKKGGVERSASSLAGTLAYWIVLLLTFFSISKMLDIEVVNSLSAVALASVPSLLAALLIVVIGLILISFVSNFVLTVARNAGSLNATLLARIVKYAGNTLVIVIALEELGLGKTIISAMEVMRNPKTRDAGTRRSTGPSRASGRHSRTPSRSSARGASPRRGPPSPAIPSPTSWRRPTTSATSSSTSRTRCGSAS